MSDDEVGKSGKVWVITPVGNSLKEWVHVTTNLVTDLLESQGFTAIVVFVDKVTKMSHFSPCTKEVNAMEYAKIFINNVFQLHSLPKVIISDQDPRFTSKLW